jgi:hypothetical protein
VNNNAIKLLKRRFKLRQKAIQNRTTLLTITEEITIAARTIIERAPESDLVVEGDQEKEGESLVMVDQDLEISPTNEI